MIIADRKLFCADPTLADLRNATGLSTRQVAPLIGLTHARIVQIECKGTKNMDQIEMLAIIYGVSEDIAREANKRTRSGK